MDDPGLPIKLGSCSNGEYVPPPTSDVVREAVRRARRMCDENARRIGMDRRDFLLTSMGAATALFALAACSSESKEGSGGGSGGSYDVPEEATVDAEAALEALGSDQPVVDVQTHFLEYPPGYTGFSLAEVWPYKDECGAEDPNDCFTVEHWIEEIFGRSDTTVAVLSCLPIPEGSDPMSAEAMARARAELEGLCEEGRVLVQGHGQPNFGDIEAMLDAMAAEADEFDVAAWKSYTHVGEGWSLDDSIGQPVGEAYLGKIEELGTGILCVHKGFGTIGGDPRFASPADVGPAAKNHPDINFCIYHSGFEAGVAEGPYDASAPNGGVDRFVKTLEDASIEPGSNVYAELGSTWRTVMGDPDQAAHVLGKLLLAVGEDRILWGTDSIWYGSPQDQIQALRTFQISDEFQERYGYPELTDEIKHKIFWRNAAGLHGIDVARVPCETDQAAREELRSSLRRPNRTYGPRTVDQARQVFAAEHHYWTKLF